MKMLETGHAGTPRAAKRARSAKKQPLEIVHSTTDLHLEVGMPQMDYLKALARKLRAEPADVILALAMACIEMRDGDEDNLGFYRQALTDFVDKRKVPAVTDEGGWLSMGKAPKASPEAPSKSLASVQLSEELQAIFQPAADAQRATVGQIILALACDRLEMDTFVGKDEGDWAITRLLWNTHAGFVPRVDGAWADAGFPVKRKEEKAEVAR